MEKKCLHPSRKKKVKIEKSLQFTSFIAKTLKQKMANFYILHIPYLQLV